MAKENGLCPPGRRPAFPAETDFYQKGVPESMVPAEGLEPPWERLRRTRGILSPLRLPFRHAGLVPLPGIEPRSRD